MSTSKTYQQSLAEAGSETRPPMLERGSYIPWASRFKRFLNRKRENRKWLLKALEDGPYVFRNITPTGSALPRLQEVEDLQGDDLLYYDAEMELTNMILLSIPNEIYNSVDSLDAKEMWIVLKFDEGTIQNQVNRETRLQPEWLKYVTQVRLAKKLTVDSFDDLFDYLLQFEKLVNTSRAKKLEKSHDPLALVAQTGSSSRSHVLVIYQAVVQGDRVNIQSRNSGNVGRNNRRAYVQGEVVEGMNATNDDSKGSTAQLFELLSRHILYRVNAITVVKGNYARELSLAKGSLFRSISWSNCSAKQVKQVDFLLMSK
ncbi:hypothetical protein Tco_0708436 [Tanacetum coccineum]